MNTPMVITIEKEMLAKHCLLLCTHCGTTTNHILNRSKEFYGCLCGEIVEIELKEIEDETI